MIRLACGIWLYRLNYRTKNEWKMETVELNAQPIPSKFMELSNNIVQGDINDNNNTYYDDDILFKNVMHSLTLEWNDIHAILCHYILFDSRFNDSIVMYYFG